MRAAATTAPVTPAPGTSALGRWRDLALTDDRKDLVDSARRHFAERFPIAAARAAFDAPGRGAPGWQDIASSGYPLVGVSERDGGAGSMTDLVWLLEEAGRALLPVPLLATVLSHQTLRSAGLRVDAADEAPSALGLGEGSASGDHARIHRFTALDGAAARHLTIVLTGDGPEALVVRLPADRVAAGVSVHDDVDPSRPLVVGAASDVACTAIARAEEGVDAVLARARTALAADLTGTAAGALDRAVRHAGERVQFGRVIGAFQAVKHKLADTYVAVEKARSLTRAAAVAIDAAGHETAEARQLSLLAKAVAAEAAVTAGAALVQVCGAMALTFEADAHLFFRRAQQTAPVLGTADDCYQRAVEYRIEGRI